RGDGRGIIGAVAVQVDENSGIGGGSRASETGEPITAADRNHLGATLFCPRGRGVAAAAVDHDNATNNIAWQTGEHGADRLRFIECRDDGGDGWVGGRRISRLPPAAAGS